MAEGDVAPSFGAELKDGFKTVHAWVSGGIAWLNDIELFFRERHAIEKEYSQKLHALAKKYHEKKAKKSSSLSVGDTPTVTPGSLESASMTTWTVQLTTLENRATEHERFANALIGQVAEPLKHLASKHEDLRKSHAEYAAKLEKERDSSYADLKKIKGRYDGVCQEVENKRKKVESSFDHGKQKAQAALQHQQVEMRNAKNTYLISIDVTNKQKERYYHDSVPDLLDSMQCLSEVRISALNNLWMTAAGMEAQALQNSIQLLEHLSGEIPRNNPMLDSIMFAQHNASPWQDPPNFVFEPSPVWLDDDVIASDPSSKIFLMNILTKSKSLLGPLAQECDAKRREVESAKRVQQAIREGKDKRDEVEVLRTQFRHQKLLHEAERKRVTAEVEVSTITSAVGDLSIGACNHKFKNQTYKIPTSCDLCGDRLWGLNAKGLSCEDCGFTCHTKCELKVLADCPGGLNKEQKKSAKASRQAAAQAAQAAPLPATSNGDHQQSVTSSLRRNDTIGSMKTLSSGYAASANRIASGMAIRSSVEEPASATSAAPPSTTISSASTTNRPRMMAPPPITYIDHSRNAETSPTDRIGKMLYAYSPHGDGEILVQEGETFTVLEPDDGSGWIKIKPHDLGAIPGLVPASYAELSIPSTSPRPISSAAVSSHSTTSLTGGSGDDGLALKKKVGPAVAPRRRGAVAVKKYVEALYTYEANGCGETGMEEGERLVLWKADEGDGWCEVEGKLGRGVVPASWVKEVSVL